MNEYGYSLNSEGVYEEAAYMGDDILDIPPMMLCKVRAYPAMPVYKISRFLIPYDTAEETHFLQVLLLQFYPLIRMPFRINRIQIYFGALYNSCLTLL